MPTFSDTFPGPALDPQWTLSSAVPANVTVDGALNFAVTASGQSHTVTASVVGGFTGGRLTFRVNLPDLSAYMGTNTNEVTYKVKVQSVDGARFVHVMFYTLGSHAGDRGFGVELWYEPASGFPASAYVSFDATRPYFRLTEVGNDAVLVETSADGLTYATLTTVAHQGQNGPWSLPAWSATGTKISVRSLHWGRSAYEGPFTFGLDDVELRYTGQASEVTSTGSGQWNLARLPLSGQFLGSVATFV